MADIMYNILNSKYNKNQNQDIKNRIDNELKMLDLNDMEGEFRAVYEMIKYLRDKNIPYITGGTAANSFLLYILGITAANPLKPHYYCRECGKIEFSDQASDGFDLPDRNCECGRRMEKDGHNLAPEQFWGVEGETSISAHQIPVKVPQSAFPAAKDFIESHRDMQHLQKNVGVNGLEFNCENIIISSDSKLPENDPGWHESIDTNEMREYLIGDYKNVLSLEQSTEVHPSSFKGVLKMYGLTRSTWKGIENVKKLKGDESDGRIAYSLEDFGYSLDVVPSYFDDVFDILVKEDFPPAKAHEEAANVRFGRGISKEILDTLFENDSLPWCGNAVSLLPRAQGIEELISAFRLSRYDQRKKEAEAQDADKGGAGDDLSGGDEK